MLPTCRLKAHVTIGDSQQKYTNSNTRNEIDVHKKPTKLTSAHSRRSLMLIPTTAAIAYFSINSPSHASKLPAAADRAWESIGGGPSDITFPESFLGTWNVQSILTTIQLPLGPEMVPDISLVKRAETQDKDRVINYQVSFVRNSRDQVVYDRRFNTASLLHTYIGQDASDLAQCITWDINDPNILDVSLPDNGVHIMTRVTRRSERSSPDDARMECSEFFQEILEYNRESAGNMNTRNDDGGGVINSSRKNTMVVPKVKASQAFTKYHWRSADQAGLGGPEIVATQVVSEYLPMPTMDGNRFDSMTPVTMYTYKMAFTRAADSSVV